MNHELVSANPAAHLPAMTVSEVEKVRAMEGVMLQLNEPVEFPTDHLIHGGMYARTLSMKAGEVLTGALMKLPTVLIVSGDAAVFIGSETIELRGYTVLPGSSGRKQLILAHTDVHMTMLFPTDAATVAECERAFTDEWAQLMTNRMDSVKTLITGE